jgi:hypothetical protein
MNDTQNQADNGPDNIESVEHQRVRNLLHAFRTGLEALDAAKDIEGSFLYTEILAALIEGHQVIARNFSSFAYFVEDLWPENVGRHATVTAAQISAATFPLASLYGQITCLPMEKAKTEPLPTRAAE